MKVNSGQAASTLIPEYIGSAFDKIVTVADNIKQIKDIAASTEGSVGSGGYIGDTPPTEPSAGTTWYCTLDGRSYIWYEDADSGQWVDSSPQSDTGVADSSQVLNFSDINFKPTTLAGYGIIDALNTSGNAVLPLVNAAVTSASLMTSTTSANQVVDSASSTTYRTAKYLIQATSGTYYHACEALVIHDGTTASLVVYGDVMTGPSLMVIDADVFNGNVRLLATPSNGATTIKAVRISIYG